MGRLFSTLSAFAPAALYFAFSALWVFGIFRSFDRDSVSSGIVSVVVPPWGFYRGVAAIWEPPKWQKDYPNAATAIAIVLLADAPGRDTAKKLEQDDLERKLKDFVAKLPQAEAKKLRVASDGLKDGICALTRLELAEILKADLAPARADLAAAESALTVIPEYGKQWTRYKEDERASIKEAFEGKDSAILEDPEAVGKIKVSIAHVIQVAETEVKRRQADIFGEP